MTAAEFIEYWYGRLTTADGFSEEEIRAAEATNGCPYPPPLRELYARAGKHRMFRERPQDYFVPLTRPNEGFALLWDENQSVVSWCLREDEMGMQDPIVALLNGNVVTEIAPLSQFLPSMVMYQSLFTSPHSANGNGLIEPDEVAKRIGVVPLGIDIGWPHEENRLFQKEDLILHVQGRPRGYDPAWYWFAARNARALAQAIEPLELEWVHWSDGKI